MTEPRRFLPRRVGLDALGDGGFRFGDMSHRGSLLGLPSGMQAWNVATPAEFSEDAFAPVLAEAGLIDILLVGTGNAPVPLSEALRWRFRDAGISVETATTGIAARTWNVLLAENRRVAAALLAVA